LFTLEDDCELTFLSSFLPNKNSKKSMLFV
jgi:hypothetical protein